MISTASSPWTRGNLHVNFNVIVNRVPSGLHVESPQDPGNVQRDRSGSEMHAGTHTTTPAEGAVTEGAGVVTFRQETVRLELVWFGEVLFVEVN